MWFSLFLSMSLFTFYNESTSCNVFAVYLASRNRGIEKFSVWQKHFEDQVRDGPQTNKKKFQIKYFFYKSVIISENRG